MASDPRLNLISFGLTANVGPTPSDNCNTSQGVNFSLSASLGSKSSSLSLSASTGSFQNLATGGGGTVGTGLRNLVSISDQIRIGGSGTFASLGLPTSSTAGSEFVLGQVGLSSSSLAKASSVNATVTATASTQASVIYNQVSQGAFTSSMVTNAFSGFQNAANLISSIFTPPASATTPQNTQFGQTCGASQYALDLIKLAPKYKFLFVVQFEFDPAFQAIMNQIDPAFVVKQTSRPNVEFDYEDINQYNFHTKVAKKLIYQEMQMRFYDDNHNNIFQFYNAYLKIASPIANIDIETQSVDPLDAYDNVGGGMGFSQTPLKINTAFGSGVVGQGYAASLGPFGSSNTTRNILRSITLFHVYQNGTMMNVYNFYNPKIKSLKLDDLDMTQTGDGSEVSIDFTYDSVYIVPGFRVAFNNTQYDLSQITGRNAMYPFGVKPGSIASDGNPKDGTGLDYGQNTEFSNSLASTIPTPTALNSAFDSSDLPVPNVNIPADTSGGNDSDGSQVGNTDDLSEITTTAQRMPDPVTGQVQNSADNTGNLSSNQAALDNQLSALTAGYNAALAVTTDGPGRQALTEKFNQQYAALVQQSKGLSSTYASESDIASGIIPGGSIFGGGSSSL